MPWGGDRWSYILFRVVDRLLELENEQLQHPELVSLWRRRIDFFRVEQIGEHP